MIEIQNLHLIRGRKTVVSDFSASIAKAQITVIMGANGSGKSTILAALAGDIPYQQGNILINGRELSTISLSEQSEFRSVVLQERNYWLGFTSREVIAMGQPHSALARMDSVIATLNMSGFIDQKVTTLSGGERQRVEIARALVRDSELYLLDEPLAAQDSASRAAIIEVLVKLRSEGKTIVLVAHSEISHLQWCDKVIDITS